MNSLTNRERIAAEQWRRNKYQKLKETPIEELNPVQKGLLKKYEEEFKEPRYGSK